MLVKNFARSMLDDSILEIQAQLWRARTTRFVNRIRSSAHSGPFLHRRRLLKVSTMHPSSVLRVRMRAAALRPLATVDGPRASRVLNLALRQGAWLTTGAVSFHMCARAGRFAIKGKRRRSWSEVLRDVLNNKWLEAGLVVATLWALFGALYLSLA
eukprot:1802165-Pleurochrysis_carterae.AAC.1